jgi:dihydrolipoamide dehydrogenase
MASRDDVRQLVVIGAGPGGYAAAFHAADLGIRVTLIDPEQNPGGVCLYRGCIPTKALLHVAKVIQDARDAKEWGIELGEPGIDVEKLRNWKGSVVRKLTQGLGQLCRTRKVEYIRAKATFGGGNTLNVQQKRNGTEKISFEHAVLAAGASPVRIPGIPYESPAVMDSNAALELPDIPKSMLVIGGGYIGLEIGSIYASLGTKVSVVEMTPNLMPGSDQELISVLAKQLKGLFESIMLSTKVARLEEHNDGLRAVFEGEDVEQKEGIYEKALVAVGREPNSSGIGLENTNVEIKEKGFVRVDKARRTDDGSIYAVGDIAGAPLLAHKATHEAIVAAKAIAGLSAAFEPKTIPFVEYTSPEVAGCGLSERQAKEQNRNIEVTKFPWSASGRAASLGQNVGLTKLIVDADSGQVLGMGIVGANAGDLISEGALAVEMGSVALDLAMTIHPHPTLSETLMESAAIFSGDCISLYRPRRPASK